MDTYLGQIYFWPLPWAPRGYLLCQGQLLPIAQNQALFSLLGTTYGGNGVTTFALPDLRGRTMVHQSGNAPLGATAGTENVTLTAANLPAHSHTVTNGNGSFGFSGNLPNLPATGSLPASTAAATSKTPGASVVPAKSADWSAVGVDNNIYGTPDGSATLPVNINIPGGQTLTVTSAPTVGTAAGSSGNTGGNQPHNNMQPYLVVNYIIATQGIFPSRS